MHAGKDPYFIQYYRVNFDGTGLTALTTEDGTHTVTYSADRQFYVDSWSRVDLPAQTPCSSGRATNRSCSSSRRAT